MGLRSGVGPWMRIWAESAFQKVASDPHHNTR